MVTSVECKRKMLPLQLQAGFEERERKVMKMIGIDERNTLFLYLLDTEVLECNAIWVPWNWFFPMNCELLDVLEAHYNCTHLEVKHSFRVFPVRVLNTVAVWAFLHNSLHSTTFLSV